MTRERLVETAVKLAYRQGFHQTSLADVARESGVPLGNIYYHFKTKEALGAALIEVLAFRFDRMRQRWAALPDPKARLEAFVTMTADNRDALVASGCPVGTLCSELHKAGGPLAEHASTIFATTLTWMEDQFREAGLKDARALAVQLLSALEGASLLTHCFHDPTYIVAEAERLRGWLRTL